MANINGESFFCSDCPRRELYVGAVEGQNVNVEISLPANSNYLKSLGPDNDGTRAEAMFKDVDDVFGPIIDADNLTRSLKSGDFDLKFNRQNKVVDPKTLAPIFSDIEYPIAKGLVDRIRGCSGCFTRLALDGVSIEKICPAVGNGENDMLGFVIRRVLREKLQAENET
ncbi:MAG TPA: hypothetical protein VLG25_00035 [Patescibacteria group bacterium]|nr:hypothetical protein [Patescibacteria group bacterium]